MTEAPRDDPEPYDMRATAYHEAGHATVAVRWDLAFDWVAINPLPPHFEGRIGDVVFEEDDHGMVYFSQELGRAELQRCWFARLQMTFAGPLAQSKYRGRPVCPGGSDRSQIWELETASAQGKWDLIADDCWRYARIVVEESWPQIEAVAAALIERQHLTGEEVKRIVDESLAARRDR